MRPENGAPNPAQEAYRLSLGRKVLIIGATVLTLANCTSSAPTMSPEKSPAASECFDPTADEITAVRALFDAPEDEYYTERMQQGWEEQAASDFKGDYVQQAIVDINQHAAEMNGLTTFNYLEYSRPLADDTYIDTTKEGWQDHERMPFAEYYKVAKEFAALYGVDLILGGPEDTLLYDGHNPTDAQLEADSSKTAMLNLITSLGVLPKEFIESTGLKKIRLMYSDNPKNIGGYANVSTGDTYVINVKFSLDQEVFNHEISHLSDFQDCGTAMHVDPNFRALNGQDRVYTDDGVSLDETTSASDIEAFYDKHLTELSHASKSGDKATYCGLEKEVGALDQQSLSESDYGLTNPAEDKAEIMKGPLTILQEGSPMPSKNTPIIYEKTMFLLARLYHKLPNVVRYFATINDRPDQTDSSAPKIDCTKD